MANFSDEHVVLLEETVRVGKDVISENEKLRDELKSTAEEHKKVMDKVLKELQNLRENTTQRRERRTIKQRSPKVVVPPSCRRTLRKVFKALNTKEDFHGFYLEQSVDSPNNFGIFHQVKDEMYHYLGGVEKCQWTAAQLEEAFKRYFLTTFETHRKKASGRYEVHKRKCRRQGRKREKLTRRTLALDKINWDKKKKAKMAEVLHENYISSEDTDCEDGKSVYTVKELSWESKKLARRKKALDKFFTNQQSERTKERRVKRVHDMVLSARGKPDDCPAWACRSDNNQE